MSKVSKYVKLDSSILLEYIYDDANLISEPYNILVDSRDRSQSYISSPSSITGNTIGNQLFEVDSITGKYSKVNTSYYSFLQLKDYSSGLPIKYDTLKFHIPINWTFGEYLGFYIKVYAFDTVNQSTYDISNFYFDMTDISQQYLLNFSTPPMLFQEKLWGKNISINIPSIGEISSELVNNLPKENSINANLTNGSGLNTNSPIFIDFHFITNIQTINGITYYLLSPEITTTIPQTPEYERLGLTIQHSLNGDFFEIYGTYNNTIAEFNKFIQNSYYLGNRYYIQYDITTYEQNVRGKTITITQTDNFNESVEYRPIIKYTTTTAIIDVEMRMIDSVDNSTILRRASYGMLQNEVSKYSLSLMKINLSNAHKPKIYNIKNNIDPSLVGVANSMGMITSTPISSINAATGVVSGGSNKVTIQTVNVPFPVLSDRYNIIGKSENALLNSTTFYGLGQIQIVLYPFDNVIRFILANGDPLAPNYLDMTGYGDIKLVFKNDKNIIEVLPYIESNSINLSIGQIAFKITQNKMSDIKKIYESGINIFYITSLIQNITSVVYTGLFKIYDNTSNVAQLNTQANATPTIIKDPNLIQQQTATVTRQVVSDQTAASLKVFNSTEPTKIK